MIGEEKEKEKRREEKKEIEEKRGVKGKEKDGQRLKKSMEPKTCFSHSRRSSTKN